MSGESRIISNTRTRIETARATLNERLDQERSEETEACQSGQELVNQYSENEENVRDAFEGRQRSESEHQKNLETMESSLEELEEAAELFFKKLFNFSNVIGDAWNSQMLRNQGRLNHEKQIGSSYEIQSKIQEALELSRKRIITAGATEAIIEVINNDLKEINQHLLGSPVDNELIESLLVPQTVEDYIESASGRAEMLSDRTRHRLGLINDGASRYGRRNQQRKRAMANMSDSTTEEPGDLPDSPLKDRIVKLQCQMQGLIDKLPTILRNDCD